MSTLKSELWVDKYRPRKISDVVLPDEYKIDFDRYIKDKDIPNLLLSGAPGSGKTTCAHIITSKEGVLQFPNDNLLFLNGSSKDSRGINFVNDIIEPFLRMPPAGTDKYRIVFIDEGDFLTDAAFSALRGVIEKYQTKYGRFLLTCNYVNKIPDALRSRFTGDYIFKKIPTEFVEKYTSEILDKENVKYDKTDLKYLIDSLYPDVRKIVGCLQRFSKDGNLSINKNSLLTNEKVVTSHAIEVISFMKMNEPSKVNNPITNILDVFSKDSIDLRQVYSSLFFDKNIPVYVKIIINKYANDNSKSMVEEMHFMAMLYEIILAISTYNQQSGKFSK
jgi:replication factor C small subunit